MSINADDKAYATKLYSHYDSQHARYSRAERYAKERGSMHTIRWLRKKQKHFTAMMWLLGWIITDE